jgi:UDP-glucuronate decarboxylase
MNAHLQIIYKDLKTISDEIKEFYPKISGSVFLITGPESLLGSYIVDVLAYLNDQKLLEKPCKIIGLQRTATTKDSRLGHLLNRKDVVLIQHDAIFPFSPSEKIDYIIHAAGRSAPAVFQSDPLGTIDVNVKGLRWLLDYSRKNTVKSLLYMSSGEIYGNPSVENIPTTETYNGNVSTLAPRACYIESKRLCETLCAVYHRLYSIPAKIARPFIIYGPGLLKTDKRVMAEFINSGINKHPIEMLNEGKDTRSYCYITDGTIAFFKLLFSEFNADPFNIASDLEEISIKNLAKLVHELCGITESVKVKESPDVLVTSTKFVKDAPNRVFPDISKAKKLLGYMPKVFIKEGLSNTISWNKEYYK